MWVWFPDQELNPRVWSLSHWTTRDVPLPDLEAQALGTVEAPGRVWGWGNQGPVGGDLLGAAPCGRLGLSCLLLGGHTSLKE